MCSRKNFVFLFGALINLTVRVDAYFHPIRMTYPIQPGPNFPGSTKLGKSRQTLSSSELFRQGQTHLLSALLIAAASRHYEESHLIYRPLESILLDQGFPVEYELDEFNPPHTRTTLSRCQLWLCRLRCKISLRHPATSSPGQHFLETCFPQTTRTTHSWVTISFLSLTSKHDFCYTYGDHISLRHSTMP